MRNEAERQVRVNDINALVGLLADAAWVEGWLETVHKDELAHQRAQALRVSIAKLLKAKSAEVGLEMQHPGTEIGTTRKRSPSND